MRLGTPMYKRAAERLRYFVTVEWPDGRVDIRKWRGWRWHSVSRAAKAKYAGAVRVAVGRGF